MISMITSPIWIFSPLVIFARLRVSTAPLRFTCSCSISILACPPVSTRSRSLSNLYSSIFSCCNVYVTRATLYSENIVKSEKEKLDRDEAQKGFGGAYQRSRGGRGARGRASLTRSVRPPKSLPSRAVIALLASSWFAISTKPKPRNRPVSLSLTNLTELTSPYCPKRSFRSFSSLP